MAYPDKVQVKSPNVLLERMGPTYRVPVQITSGVEFAECRSLLVGTAGTATLTDRDGGVAVDVPLQAGYNPIGGIVKVEFGSAANIWALL